MHHQRKNIAQHMTREPDYIPKSAKASDFKITLSKGALEDGERVSFLEQQIQQAKDTYESSLKIVIEECITLETTTLQSQENDMIYTLLPSLAEAISTLEGITTDVHQKVVSLIYLDSSFLSYMTSKSRKSFISSYCTHHNLDTIPSPSIHPLSNTHTSATECNTELLLHTKSLQLPNNKGLQTFRKPIESIIIMPSASFKKQIEENNREIILKKLSREIILGKMTESTAMELDAEGRTSFEQLQDLIKKNVTNEIKSIDLWNRNTTNCRTHLNVTNHKKTCKRGTNMAPQTKRNHPKQTLEGCQINVADPPQSDDHKRNIANFQPQNNLQTRGQHGASNKKKSPQTNTQRNQRGRSTSKR